MIDNYLLEELVTFAKTGTLAKTAQELMITQPTVTRGMQKLEDELGVQIFDRQPNRIRLSKTGQLAAKEAEKVLQANQSFIKRVQNFAASQQVVKVKAVAPGPLLIADQLAASTSLEVDHQFIKPTTVEQSLINNEAAIVFTNHELQTERIESLFMGTEKLFINLDKFMFLANKQSVQFADLKGFSFVVDSQIGIWKDIIAREIPEAKFLYQTEREAMQEITRYSNFPYFSTDITRRTGHVNDENDDRVCIPIADPAAKMDFYATYLKANRKNLKPVLQQFNQAWNK